MKTRYIKLLSLIAIVMLTSCGKATYLKCDKEGVSVSMNGGEGKVALRCDGRMEVAYAPEWAEANIEGDELHYIVGANPSNTLRKSHIIVTSGELSTAIEISQTTVGSYLVIPKPSVSIDKNGVGGKIKVLTDGEIVTVDCPEGVTYVYDSGILSFSSLGHTGRAKSLKATVRCGEFSQNITITQKGDICTTCGGRGRITCSKCDGDGGWGYYYWYTCSSCNGNGYHRCKTCGGTGKI